MGSLIGGVVALLVGALLAVGVSTAVVSSQHPDSKTESGSSDKVGPNETSDQSVLDYGVR
ncbi:MAG TPA: hypothetical protein VHJ83_12020 [Micromonosporaceae bacterium]|nr:hypothetical protein [Micromonosporaceae bacterium]